MSAFDSAPQNRVSTETIGVGPLRWLQAPS